MENKTKTKRKFKCKDCGTTENVTYAPNPYAAEIREDYTKVRMCKDCRYESSMDI